MEVSRKVFVGAVPGEGGKRGSEVGVCGQAKRNVRRDVAHAVLQPGRDDDFVGVGDAEPTSVKAPVVAFAQGDAVARVVVMEQAEALTAFLAIVNQRRTATRAVRVRSHSFRAGARRRRVTARQCRACPHHKSDDARRFRAGARTFRAE